MSFCVKHKQDINFYTFLAVTLHHAFLNCRQERLKQLAEKFERKAALRESWLSDMITVLSDQNFGNNTSQVEAALKKHEAISSDIEARVCKPKLSEQMISFEF